VCNRENLDQFQFCGFCGSNLEGKIKCSKCEEWVDENFSFCPHCSNKLKPKTVVKGKMSTFQKNKLNAIITNSLVISLCLGLFFILFAGIGIRNFVLDDEKIQVSINLVDVCEATLNDITRYSMDDYREDMSRFNNVEDLTRFYKSVNLLNALAIEDIFTIQTVFLYIIFIILL